MIAYITPLLILTQCLAFNIPSRRVFSGKSLAMMVTTDDIFRSEAARYFLKDLNGVVFKPTSGGVNNVMDYVFCPNGEQYVLRIYNNGLNSARVTFEHRVLDELLSKNKFSFKIPTAIKSIVNGKKHVLLSNGAEASMFELIPGQLPKKDLSKVKDIGRCAGELASALGNIVVDLESPNPPYYDLFKAHHAVSKELFFEELKKPVFDADPNVRKYTDLLAQEIIAMEASFPALQAMNLPKQLIHGDLHYDNVLCDGDKVSGLLDFEFCAYDWRVMEFAVCLSKYAGEPGAFDIFLEFIDGFAEKGRLTEAEIKLVPQLINLRILSNVVYFVGRAIAGEDGIEALTTRAEMYYKRIVWIKEKEQDIIKAIASKIHA